MTPIREGGVYKRILRHGSGDDIAPDNAVCYHLVGYLEDIDEPIDSTYKRHRPYLHRLDCDYLIKGIYLGLLSMKKGERSEFLLYPDYAFLAQGCPPRIPPNSTIFYVIEVLKVLQEGSLAHYECLLPEEKRLMPIEKILQLCDGERKLANAYFSKEQYRQAAFTYKKVIRCLENVTLRSQGEEDEVNKLLLKLYCNNANCCVKLQKPFLAISLAKRALDIQPECAKALFHLGKARFMNDELEAAIDCLRKAQKLKPNNSTIAEALRQINQKMEKDIVVEKELYHKMSKFFS